MIATMPRTGLEEVLPVGFASTGDSMSVTDIAPTIRSSFDLPCPEWMNAARSPAIRVAERS